MHLLQPERFARTGPAAAIAGALLGAVAGEAGVPFIVKMDIEGHEKAVFDSKSAPGWIVPAYGYTWPDTLQAINAVTVTYTAGYANAAAVPAVIKHWMLAHIAMSDANAELTAQGAGIKIITNPYLDRLLDRYCVNVAA